MSNNHDYIEEFFEQNRKEFQSEEPGFGHFNRFARKLEKLHDEADGEAKSSNSRFSIYGIAAGLVILLSSVGILFFSTADDQLASPAANSNEYYQSSDAIPISSNSLQRMNELEVEYLQLKFKYSQTNDSAILAKIRENLSERAAYIESMRSEQSLNSYTTNASHEQCCGFGNEFNPHNQRDLYGQVSVAH